MADPRPCRDRGTSHLRTSDCLTAILATILVPRPPAVGYASTHARNALPYVLSLLTAESRFRAPDLERPQAHRVRPPTRRPRPTGHTVAGTSQLGRRADALAGIRRPTFWTPSSASGLRVGANIRAKPALGCGRSVRPGCEPGAGDEGRQSEAMSESLEPAGGEIRRGAHEPVRWPLAAAVAWTQDNTPAPGMMSGVAEARLLEALIVVGGARHVLEIGTFTGVGALTMAAALPRMDASRRSRSTTTLPPLHAATSRRVHIGAASN